MECFKRALKITDANFNTKPDEKNFKLYVSILNKFLYFFNDDNFHAVILSDFSYLNYYRLDLKTFKDAWRSSRPRWRRFLTRMKYI